MNKEEINEIIECLPKGRTRFFYFKDRYALLLLRLALDAPASKNEVRGTAFARLLEKPIVKSAIGGYGNSAITAELLDAHWPASCERYVLTLGVWGRGNRLWTQTSRTGFNLVLQLNFSTGHDAAYRRLLDPEGEYPFEDWCHPIAEGKRHTLAWSRLDIDLARGEALIEEIQNDWLRNASKARRWARRNPMFASNWGKSVTAEALEEYWDKVLMPYAATWDEAMLAATIWFLRAEIGVSTIYYHTHRDGAALKRIRGTLPPRSLYTSLPRRFCFERTKQSPEMLVTRCKAGPRRRMIENAEFQVLRWD